MLPNVLMTVQELGEFDVDFWLMDKMSLKIKQNKNKSHL
jgi:hypothetical protein